MQIEPAKINPSDELNSKIDILRAQLQFHNMQMINTFEKSMNGAELEIELSTGKSSMVRVCPISSDGDCLFGSCVHQHFRLEVGSDEYVQRVVELRKKVVAHIKENLICYKRMIMDRIFNQKEKNLKTHNPDEQCTNFLENYLSREGHWGGSESISAISELFKVNIIIFDECAGVRSGNSFNSLYKDIITIAFRFSKGKSQKENASHFDRNHFDSIVRLSEDVLSESASILIANYSKNCAIKNISGVIALE